ncbi:MAG: hypothetical protein KBT49_03740 [Bacteroidetes bacterium]|nr:hypothetical protein [Candidatus Colenecus caballi]
MNKSNILTILLLLASFCSCTSEHDSTTRDDSFNALCDGIVCDYLRIDKAFNEFLFEGKESDVRFEKTAENSWRVNPDRKDSYLSGVTMTIDADSVPSYGLNGYIVEDKLTTHIFTSTAAGIRKGNGRIIVQITLNSAKYGTASIQFTDYEAVVSLNK